MSKRLKQWLGLSCKHPYLSLPISGHRSCAECGQQFQFTQYQIAPGELHQMAHYETREPGVRRIEPGTRRLLRWPKQK
jgi:hypothetical protein